MTYQFELSANFIDSIILNENKLDISNKYSFNDFFKNFTLKLNGKKFRRIDTGELLGCFKSVSSSSSDIHAKLNGGIINFIYELENYSRQTTIYGDTIDLNEKIFEEC